MDENSKLKLLLEFLEYIFTATNTVDLFKRTNDFFVQTFKLANSNINLENKNSRYYTTKDLENNYSIFENYIRPFVKNLKTPLSLDSLKNDELTKKLPVISQLPNSTFVIPLTFNKNYLGEIFLYSDKSLKNYSEILNALSTKFLKAYLMLKHQDLIKKSSITDELTGLFNRKYMNEYLTKTIERAREDKKPTSLIIFDIDNFKKFNDTKGHIEGDKLLKKVSSIAVSLFRYEDVVCRYGGEEFVIILKNTDREDCLKRAEELRIKIKEKTGETVSVGLMTSINSSLNPQEMLKHADEALYKAKRTGKNKVVSFISVDKSLGIIDTEQAKEMGRSN